MCIGKCATQCKTKKSLTISIESHNAWTEKECNHQRHIYLHQLSNKSCPYYAWDTFFTSTRLTCTRRKWSLTQTKTHSTPNGQIEVQMKCHLTPTLHVQILTHPWNTLFCSIWYFVHLFQYSRNRTNSRQSPPQPHFLIQYTTVQMLLLFH